MPSNTMPGGRKSKVPFPQYDFPGSKRSPFTGKPYTKAEAARVHGKTRAAGKRKDRVASAAIERRVNAKKSGPPKRSGTFGSRSANPVDLAKSLAGRKDSKGRTLADQFRDDKEGLKRALMRSPQIRKMAKADFPNLNPNSYSWANKSKKRKSGHQA